MTVRLIPEDRGNGNTERDSIDFGGRTEAGLTELFSNSGAALACREEEVGRRLLEAVVATAGDAIISVDAEHRIVLFNVKAEGVFGYSTAEVLGKSLDMLLPMDVRHVHRGQIAAFQSGKERRRMMGERIEIRGLRKDGSLFPAEASISKIDAPGGMLLTAVVRDISERKRLESKQTVLFDQLRALNDRFELALDNMTHGLAFYDVDHQLLVWNRRLEEMFRLPPGAFREGMAWREVLQIVADINFPPRIGSE